MPNSWPRRAPRSSLTTIRSATPAEELAGRIKAKGGSALAVGADVSQEADVASLFAKTLDAFGAVDILVANSGMQKDAPLTAMSLDQWEAVLKVNLTGQFLCAQAAVRQFEAQAERSVSRARGKIICMSSVHQVIPWAGHVNYAASKGGIMMMMQTIAQEVAGKGIRVNAIAPGAIRTAINEAETEGEKGRALLTLIPYGRIGVAEDVGKCRRLARLRPVRLCRRDDDLRRRRHDALSRFS